MAALACIAAVAGAQPVKTHREFIMNVQGGINWTNLQISDTSLESGYKQGWDVGMAMEFYMGRRQQFAYIVGLLGGKSAASWNRPADEGVYAAGEYLASYVDLSAFAGLRYLFRNGIYLELDPVFSLPFNQKVKKPDGSTVQGDVNNPDKDIFAFGLNYSLGYTISDFVLVFCRVRQNFADVLQHERYNPVSVKEKPLTFELGMSFGIGF